MPLPVIGFESVGGPTGVSQRQDGGDSSFGAGERENDSLVKGPGNLKEDKPEIGELEVALERKKMDNGEDNEPEEEEEDDEDDDDEEDEDEEAEEEEGESEEAEAPESGTDGGEEELEDDQDDEDDDENDVNASGSDEQTRVDMKVDLEEREQLEESESRIGDSEEEYMRGRVSEVGQDQQQAEEDEDEDQEEEEEGDENEDQEEQENENDEEEDQDYEEEADEEDVETEKEETVVPPSVGVKIDLKGKGREIIPDLPVDTGTTQNNPFKIDLKGKGKEVIPDSDTGTSQKSGSKIDLKGKGKEIIPDSVAYPDPESGVVRIASSSSKPTETVKKEIRLEVVKDTPQLAKVAAPVEHTVKEVGHTEDIQCSDESDDDSKTVRADDDDDDMPKKSEEMLEAKPVIPKVEQIEQEIEAKEVSLLDSLCEFRTKYEEVASKVNLEALIDCATSRLAKPQCTAISLLGNGSCNIIIQLDFSDGTDVAASLPKSPDTFNAAAKKSELATMAFVRESGLYRKVPVPKIYAWNLTYKNPVGLPYVFMEVIHGHKLTAINKTERGCRLEGLDALSTDEQMSVTAALSQLHSNVTNPLDEKFDMIGSLTRPRPDKGDFSIGPMFTLEGKQIEGPFPSLKEWWVHFTHKEIAHALDHWHDRKTNVLAESPDDPEGTVTDFSEALHQISILIGFFIPPEAYLQLALQHPDLSLKNIIFAPGSKTKIVGVLGWAGTKVVPLMLTARYPSDLFSSESDSILRPDIPRAKEVWKTVPYDWTYLGPESIWPKATGPDAVDLSVRGSAMVRRYYLRGYFSSQASLKFRNDMHRASLFFDAPYYLKFHELVTEGWRGWLRNMSWLSETYWRARWKVEGYDGTPRIVGPNVYDKPIPREPLILDLGDIPVVKASWQRD